MNDVLALIALTGAAAAGIVAISKLVVGIYRIAKRVDETNQLVTRELRPNGGSSLRDAVDRIERKADEALKRVDHLEHPEEP